MAAWADCFRGGAARRTWIGINIMALQQFTGINGLWFSLHTQSSGMLLTSTLNCPLLFPFPTAIVYYSPSLFAALGYAFEQQLVFSGITNGAC